MEQAAQDVKVVTRPSSPIPIDKVQSVYVGKCDRCCCGCAGKHTYTAAAQALEAANLAAGVPAGKRVRGYAIDDDEVNDARVARVVAKVNRNLESAVELSSFEGDGCGCVSVEIGKTVYVVYGVRS